MLRAAWKSIAGRKIRLLLSAFSIVLGIAFVSGSLIFTSLLSTSFDALVKGQFSDVNLAVKSLGSSQGGLTTPTLIQFDSSLIDEIAGLDGVADVTGVVNATNVYPMADNGKILAFQGAPGMATNFHTTKAVDDLDGPKIVEGKAPEETNEIAIDPDTLKRGGWDIGTEIEVSTPFDGIKKYQVTGTAAFSPGVSGGITHIFFTLPEIQELLLDGDDAFTGAWIVTNSDADPELVAEEVAELAPAGFKAATGHELANDFEKEFDAGLEFVNIFLLVFAAISLVIASLLILNTFSILIAQRSRELAMLRALGATRWQVGGSVLFEAGVVGLIGATLGLILGWLISWAMVVVLAATGIDVGVKVPPLGPETILISYGVGLLITVLAAWIPARRASATRPVEAMTAAEATGPDSLTSIGSMTGLALLQLGAAFIICGVWLDVPKPLVWAGAGGALVLVGLVLVAALIGGPVIWLLRHVYRTLFGETGRLAALNASRQPRRTAATASTLMLGLALVITVAILAASTTKSVRSQLTEGQRGDLVISSINYQSFPAGVVDDVGEIDGVEEVWAFREGATNIEGQPVELIGTSPEGLMDGSGIDILGGHLNPEDNSVFLEHKLSEELDLQLGTQFEAMSLTDEPIELLVTGIFQASEGLPEAQLVVNEATLPHFGDPDLVKEAKVVLTEGADAPLVRTEIEKATADLPTVLVSDNAEFADARAAQLSQIFALIYALLALAILIAVLGIVNTLSLSVLERTREIGLLRAVGMTRSQLRQSITLESLIVTLLGSLLGVLLGIIFGIVLVLLLKDSGISQLAIPWWQLTIFVVVTMAFGVIAAVVPSKRAANLDVVRAIAAE